MDKMYIDFLLTMRIDQWIKLGSLFVLGIIVFINKIGRESFKYQEEEINKIRERQKNNPIKILYLRDFDKDGLQFVGKELFIPGYGMQAVDFMQTNVETDITFLFRDTGHVIAIGKPSIQGDLGADRITLINEEWQSYILGLMESSSAIVFRPSLSVGLIWEFNQLVAYGYLSKSIIILSRKEDGRSDYKLFKEIVGTDIKLPKFSGFSKYIYFDSEMRCYTTSSITKVPIYKHLQTS